MTNTKLYKDIKSKIVSANEDNDIIIRVKDREGKEYVIKRDITLEMVLVAMKEKGDWAIRCDGEFMFENSIINGNFTGMNYDDEGIYWKLKTPLHLQSIATQELIKKILC